MCRNTKRLRDLRGMVERMGLQVVSLEISGGSHVRMRLRSEDQERTVFSGHSPSDWRSERNFRSQIRRMFNQPAERGH